MRDLKMCDLLQLMGGPVTEVERAGAAKLKGIATRGDVLDMQLRAALHQTLQSRLLQVGQSPGQSLDLFKEGFVANERHLDRLDDSVPALAHRQ